jgi:hypothetical protein
MNSAGCESVCVIVQVPLQSTVGLVLGLFNTLNKEDSCQLHLMNYIVFSVFYEVR